MQRWPQNKPDGSVSSETLAFLQDILGTRVQNATQSQAELRAERKNLEWLAGISTRHECELSKVLREEREAAERAGLEQRLEGFLAIHEAQWDPAKHPRRGSPPNAGWFATTGSTSRGEPSRSFFDVLSNRHRTVSELIGGPTPEMIRASRLTIELQSAAEKTDEIARAAGAGLLTGGKAVVNGTATAIKNVATLGLSDSQLELIGVTQADRDRGYDTAVTIATASGEILIAVGMGGVASALSKGGTVVRVASGALVAFDAAGNAVGVVRGIHDVSTNGVTIANGAQIAAGALGLGANSRTMRELSQASNSRRLGQIDEYVTALPRKVTPTTSAANQYEVRHTGPYNYIVSAGDVSFAIDGYRGTTILEAKHVGNSMSSPYVPGSTCPDLVRRKILTKAREELRKAHEIIKSGSTPFESIEIITNSAEAKKLFERILKESHVPGIVRLEP
ncbi:MAG: hypothetical protein JNG90_10765 [Planctomycetaceae bacterium]|nr:hypothetical protein [Planctomycetaceae bacterium]